MLASLSLEERDETILCAMRVIGPVFRLTLFLSQFARRRHSRKAIIFYAAVLVISIILGLIERAGYWPEDWKLERGSLPKVTPL